MPHGNAVVKTIQQTKRPCQSPIRISVLCDRSGLIRSGLSTGRGLTAFVGRWHLQDMSQDWRRTMKNGYVGFFFFLWEGWWCLTHTVFNMSEQHQSAIISVPLERSGVFLLQRASFIKVVTCEQRFANWDHFYWSCSFWHISWPHDKHNPQCMFRETAAVLWQSFTPPCYVVFIIKLQ